MRYPFLFSVIILRQAISATLNRLMDNRVINRLIHFRSIVITFPIILRETTRSPSVRLLYTTRETHETHLMHKYLASIKCLAAGRSICVRLDGRAKTCFLQTWLLRSVAAAFNNKALIYLEGCGNYFWRVVTVDFLGNLIDI